MSFPGLLVTSCLAMSSHWPASARFAMSASDSQSRYATCAYAPAGDACVTLDVDTSPTALPLAIDHSAMDCVRFSDASEPRQSYSFTLADSPIVSKLAFTPVRYAVDVHAESDTCLSTQYVWNKTDV